MKRKPNSNYVVVQENGVFVAPCLDLDVASQIPPAKPVA
jgi:hypothetical protein